MKGIRIKLFVLFQFVVFGLYGQNITVKLPKEFYATPGMTNVRFLYGPDSLHNFLLSRLLYPPSALQFEISGFVTLYLEIDAEGKVVNEKTFGEVSPILEEEVKRVIKLTDKLWTPSTQNSQNLNSWAFINVVFQIIKSPDVFDAHQADSNAQFIGGGEAFLSLISNFKHPYSGNQTEEIIDFFDITFIVNRDSTVSDIQVLNAGNSPIWKACVEEVRRVITLSNKKWIPAKHAGKYVRQRMRMPLYTCFDD